MGRSEGWIDEKKYEGELEKGSRETCERCKREEGK